MKKALVVVALLVLSLALAACVEAPPADNDTDEIVIEDEIIEDETIEDEIIEDEVAEDEIAVGEVNEDEGFTEDEVTEEVVVEVTTAANLAGTWDYMGVPYYVLNADGTGTMFGMDILWATADGIFAVCATPALCGTISECLGSADWYYTLAGNRLTLESTMFEGMIYTYTRG